MNHAAQTGAITAVIDPGLVPVAILGATAPDWLEWVIGAIRGYPVKHRTTTHVLLSWVVLAVFFGVLWDFNNYGLAFAIGGICHWMQDAVTITGVPVTWWSDRRTTLLGGRLRTGAVGEYVVSAVVIVICAGIVSARGPERGYLPFFRNWPSLYAEGLVDGAEWRKHRFEWF